MKPLGTQGGALEMAQHMTLWPLIVWVARSAVSAHEGRGTTLAVILTKVHVFSLIPVYAGSTRNDEGLSSDEGAILTDTLITRTLERCDCASVFSQWEK